jgi:nitrogen fixation/metabolism regulation signal transduction histidine kinase
MKLQHRLISYLVLIHGFFLALLFFLAQHSSWLVIASEIVLVLSLALGLYLVRKNLQPMQMLQQFQDLLHDRLYTSRIRDEINPELNQTVQLFNRLLDNLYQERIALGEQRGLLERLLEATPSAVMVFDFDGGLSLFNASAQHLLGLNSSHLGLTVAQFVLTESRLSPENLHMMAQIEVGQSSLLIDATGRSYRCQRNQFVDRGFKRDFILMDELTAELARSEKNTYEKLIRVVAHEVNNTVAATGSVLESLLFYTDQLKSDDQVDFSTAIAAVQRRNTHLGQFIERFTQVVKMPEVVRRSCSIPELVNSVMYLYQAQCQELGITLAWRECQALPEQEVDPHLFEQALMNIFKNAVEAIVSAKTKQESQEPAYIHVRWCVDENRNKNHDQNPDRNLDQNADQDAGQFGLHIIDSAGAIANLPQAQLFTPFYTTKKGGQGIGLVLVREVFNRHGLHYSLSSNAQGETEFFIRF